MLHPCAFSRPMRVYLNAFRSLFDLHFLCTKCSILDLIRKTGIVCQRAFSNSDCQECIDVVEWMNYTFTSHHITLTVACRNVRHILMLRLAPSAAAHLSPRDWWQCN